MKKQTIIKQKFSNSEIIWNRNPDVIFIKSSNDSTKFWHIESPGRLKKTVNVTMATQYSDVTKSLQKLIELRNLYPDFQFFLQPFDPSLQPLVSEEFPRTIFRRTNYPPKI